MGESLVILMNFSQKSRHFSPLNSNNISQNVEIVLIFLDNFIKSSAIAFLEIIKGDRITT